MCTQGPHPLAPTTRRLSPRHPVSLPRDHCPHHLASPSPGEHRLCAREHLGGRERPIAEARNRSIRVLTSTGEAGPQARSWCLPAASAVTGASSCSARRQPHRGRHGTAWRSRQPPGPGGLRRRASAQWRRPQRHSAGPLRAAVTPPGGCGTRPPSQRTAPPTHASRAYCDTHLCLSHAGNRTPGDGRVALTKATSEAVSPRHRRGFDMAAAYSLLRGLWLSPSS